VQPPSEGTGGSGSTSSGAAGSSGTVSTSSSGALVDSNQSCLTWYNNNANMPPGGTGDPTTDAAAVKDMDAWAAAGAKDN
jgi:hypothetical protein